MFYFHTRTTRRVNLVASIVLLLHRQLVKFPGDVVCSSGVGIPVGIYTIGNNVCPLFLMIIFFIAPPTCACTPG